MERHIEFTLQFDNICKGIVTVSSPGDKFPPMKVREGERLTLHTTVTSELFNLGEIVDLPAKDVLT